MKFSVIIVHYNAPEFLWLTLESVTKAVEGKNAEIIVADNASKNFPADDFKKAFPGVRFLMFEKNSGFGRANNEAVAQARGQYIFLINPDVVVPENLFDRLLPDMENHPERGITGIRLFDGRGQFLPESKRNIPGFLNSFLKLFPVVPVRLIPFFKPYYNTSISAESSGENPVFVGAFMGFEREKFIKTGGFDTRYFMYGEDIDLSYTFLRNGWKNFYRGDIGALHFKGESTPKTKKYQKHFVEATLLFQEKYHPFLYPLVKPLIKRMFALKFRRETKQSPKNRRRNLPVFYAGKRTDILNRLNELYENITATTTPENVPAPGLIIFDAETFSYGEMLDFMWNNREKGYYYRFIPRQADFFLGSDSATGKGEVRYFSGKKKK